MKSLSPRQDDALKAIIGHINQHGYPPTRREMADALDLSGLHGMHSHLLALENKGYIDRADKSSRGIRVLRFPDGRAAQVSVHEPYNIAGTEQEVPGGG